MKAYVLINVRPGAIRDALRDLMRVEGIREAHMTFGPYDIVAEVEASDVNQLGAMLSMAIQPIPGVTETLTCLAVDERH